MIYAPILIPTLCRYEHFIRCIESLKKNTWAQYTDIYIGLDYPAKESHWEGYLKICEYLEGDFSMFSNFYIIRRDMNFGAARNMQDLWTGILDRYKAFIRTDDDCEFSPNFIEYMDRCLTQYEQNPQIIGVTGYSYPVTWEMEQQCNAFIGAQAFPMWGIGFWSQKFKEFSEEIKRGCIFEYRKMQRDPRNKMTRARYMDFVYGTDTDEKNSWMWEITDITMGVYMQLFNKRIITPQLSLVRNYGFDGSGEYCPDTMNHESNKYRFDKQSIDTRKALIPIIDENADVKKNFSIMNRYENRSKLTYVKAGVKFWLYKTLGSEVYARIIKRK